MPKSARTTLAALVGLATVGAGVALPLNAHAASFTGTVVDGCGEDDTIALAGFSSSYTVTVIDAKGVTTTSAPQAASTWVRPDAYEGTISVKFVDSGGNVALLTKAGLPSDTRMPLTALTCVAFAPPTFNDVDGKDDDTYEIPFSADVDYLVGSATKGSAPGIFRAAGTVTIKVQAKPGKTLATLGASGGTPLPTQPVFYSRTFGSLATVFVPTEKAPKVIADPDGDVVRVWNIPGVTWSVNGTAVKLTTEPYKDVPTAGKATILVAAIATDAKLYDLTGTTQWTLTATGSVTIAKDKVPTASDQPGSRQDAVTVYAVPGVKWKVNGVDVTFAASETSKLVPTGGKTAVTVTAASADPTKYRLTGTTSWPLTFKIGTQVSIPDAKQPVANDQSGTAGDTVTVYAVDKVTWTVGRTEVVFDKGQTSKNVSTNGATTVTVKAALATGTGAAASADAEIVGTDSWDLTFNTAVNSVSARPSVAARTSEAGVSPRQSVVRWATPASLKAPATYDVAFRIVNVTPTGKRLPGAWKPWLGSTKATSAVFTGLPGGVYEVSVRATGADGTVSAWSAPSRVIVPLDIRSGGAGWRPTIDKTAASSTLLTTSVRRATWATVTPATDRIMAWVGTGPTNGYVNVVVDGTLRARINTWSARPHARQMLVNLTVEWGKHRLAFVNAPVGKRAVTKLDALAYNR